MTWLELRAAPKHGLGYEKISGVALPDHVPEDATLIAFRFHDHLSLIGYRTDRVFHALWFDNNPAGEIYKH